MNTTKSSYVVVESQTVERDYGMSGTIAIIESKAGDRYLIADGFGGMDSLSGGAVRWKHGEAVKLQPDDTIDSLRSGEWNDYINHFDAVLRGIDSERPIMRWEGYVIENIAETCGL